MKNRRLYPPQSYWNAKREERLTVAGHKCELCGVPDAQLRFNPNKPHPFYAQGKPSVVYLQLAHKSHYERWRSEADCLVVCPSCHGVMDIELRRRAASRNYAPVGIVQVWVFYQGKRYLAAESRRYDDLFEVVASFEPGMKFELAPEIMLSIVGRGFYRRTQVGIEVLKETGACRNFSAYLQDVLTGVLA